MAALLSAASEAPAAPITTTVHKNTLRKICIPTLPPAHELFAIVLVSICRVNAVVVPWHIQRKSQSAGVHVLLKGASAIDQPLPTKPAASIRIAWSLPTRGSATI